MLIYIILYWRDKPSTAVEQNFKLKPNLKFTWNVIVIKFTFKNLI